MTPSLPSGAVPPPPPSGFPPPPNYSRIMAYNILMLRRHTISFYHAFSGLIYALSTQPNFLVHIIFSCLAVIAGVLLSISRLERSEEHTSELQSQSKLVCRLL